jgi:tRNA pseudouridine38-40 synthase
MRNIRLLLAYDGTDYAGWQVQPEKRTVQGELEAAIHALTGQPVRLLSAGRTDSGVHALGQVANFQTDFPIPPPKWRPALQSRLPSDIVILESDAVPTEFHATFSARSKRYRYVIYNQLVDDPFLKRYVWRISQPLDVEAMRQAAGCLLGTHDFRSFESHWPNKATSVRTVTELSIHCRERWDVWSPQPLSKGATEPEEDRCDVPPTLAPERSTVAEPPFICLEIEADGFLYNMVRTIVGTLVNVGRGTWTEADVERILHARDRTIAGATAPARGLFLVRANYSDVLRIGGCSAGDVIPP